MFVCWRTLSARWATIYTPKRVWVWVCVCVGVCVCVRARAYLAAARSELKPTGVLSASDVHQHW